MLYSLYQGAGTGLYCLAIPLLLVLSRLLPELGENILQRTGTGLAGRTEPRGPWPRIWFHAASVGEVAGAEKLIRALVADGGGYEFILTTTTAQGREVAMKQLPGVDCFLAPLDVSRVACRYIRSIQPDVYACLETELWPCLLREMKKAGVRSVLLNGRMTEKSLRRYRLVKGMMTTTLEVFGELAVIRDRDRSRFAELGAAADRIRVTGNIKYDFPRVNIREAREKYRTRLGAGTETVFVTGSTRSGEEKLLAGVHRDLLPRAPGGMLWVVAPRHLDRLAEVEGLLASLGLEFDRYTDLARRRRSSNIVLVDCLGELAMLYSAGDHLFVGGSLVDKGGHNIMEAARWGRPVYYGPSIEDFSDAAEILELEGGGFRVADAGELTARITGLLDNRPAYRRACSGSARAVERQHGAAERQAAVVKRMLQDFKG